MHFFKASLITLVYVACVSAAAIGVPAKEAPSVDKADHSIVAGITGQVKGKVRAGLGGALGAAAGALGAGLGAAAGGLGAGLGGAAGGLGAGLGGAAGGLGAGLGEAAGGLGRAGGGFAIGIRGGLKGKLPVLVRLVSGSMCCPSLLRLMSGDMQLGSSSKSNSVDKSEGA
jgi:hypothetical protein